MKNNFLTKLSAVALAGVMALTFAPAASLTAFAADDAATKEVKTTPVYRSYNPNNGEHLLTVDKDEHDAAVKRGYTDEGEQWNAPKTGDPVYRIYNPNSGEHLLIADKVEYDNAVLKGWQGEDIKMYSDTHKGTPVYRVFNPNAKDAGSHLYTSVKSEYDYLTSHGWNGEGIQFYGVGEEAVLKLEAEQTGASTFELKSNVALTNDDAITVTRGTTEQTITKAFGTDGKTVVLTTATAITASDYVIKVVPKDTTKYKEASVTVKGQKSALKELRFESDKLVLINNAATKGTVVVNGYDQFGAKVAISNSNTKFFAAGANTVYDATTNVLTLAQSGVYPFTIGSQVAVTAVYQNGATVVQKQASLTVSAAAYIKTLEFGELGTTNVDLAGKKLTVTTLADNSWYYPIKKAQNQYDQDLTKKDLNDMLNGDTPTLYVSPGSAGYAYISGFDTLKDGTIIAKIKKGDATTVPTTVPFSFTSVNGGTFTQNLVIADDPYIASLDVSVPDAYGNSKVEVSVSAKDQDGADYDFFKDISERDGNIEFGDQNHLTGQGSSLDASQGTLSLVKDTTKKSVKIFYKYGTDAPSSVTEDTIAVKTAVPTVSTVKITVNPAGTIDKVQGLASGVKTELANGDTIHLGTGYEKNIVFLDNYGAVMTTGLPTFTSVITTGLTSGNYYYTVTLNGVADSDGDIAWTDGHTTTTVKTLPLKVTLYKATSNTEAKKINDVDTNIKFAATSTEYRTKLTSSGDLLYVSSTSTDTATLVVEKRTNGGAWETVQAGSDTGKYQLSDDIGLAVSGSNTIDAKHAGNLPDNTSGTDTLYITVDGVIVANAFLAYSNKDAVATSASWTINDGKAAASDEVTTNATAATFTDGVLAFTDDASGLGLEIQDQYGQKITTGVRLTINGVEGITDANSEALEVFKGAGAENVIVIKKGDVTKTVKVVNNGTVSP